jgi:hypothetical protein
LRKKKRQRKSSHNQCGERLSCLSKKQILKGAQEELAKQISGQKDSTVQAGAGDTKKKLEETGKGLINNLFKKKKATDSTKVNN